MDADFVDEIPFWNQFDRVENVDGYITRFVRRGCGTERERESVAVSRKKKNLVENTMCYETTTYRRAARTRVSGGATTPVRRRGQRLWTGTVSSYVRTGYPVG